MNGKAAEASSLVRTRSNRGLTDAAVPEQPSTSSGAKPLTIKPLITKPNTAAGSGKSGKCAGGGCFLFFFQGCKSFKRKTCFLEICFSEDWFSFQAAGPVTFFRGKLNELDCYFIQEAFSLLDL